MKKAGKKAKKKAAKWGVLSGALSGVASHVLVRVISDVITHSLDDHLKKGSKKKGKEGVEAAPQVDAATCLLRSLAERGPLTVADLLEHTHVGLTAALRAIRDLREFRLVEFVGDDNRVQLTDPGSRTATVLSKADIRQSAALLLGK